jgi:hypothetical protein
MRPRPRRLFVPRYIALRSRDPSNFPESLITYVGDVTQRLHFDLAGVMAAAPEHLEHACHQRFTQGDYLRADRSVGALGAY